MGVKQSADQVAAITAVLDEIRPAIVGHGGSIEFVELKDQIVYVRLVGACVGCPSSFFTLKLGVEEAIKAKVPSIKEVVAVE